MNAIHKYTCPANAVQWVLSMPKGAEILSTGMQGEDYVFWAKVDLELPAVRREFTLIPTGMPFSHSDNLQMKHCGTYQTTLDNKPFVLHLFDLGETKC